MVLGENWLQASVIVDTGIYLIKWNSHISPNFDFVSSATIHSHQSTIIIVSDQFISDIVKSSN